MGTDPETPAYEEGVKCVVCWELLFDDITPKYIEVDFSGVEACPGAPLDVINGTFLLTQSVDECLWSLVWGVYFIDFRLRPGESRLRAGSPGLVCFQSIVADDCIDAFVNQNVCGVGPVYGENGYGLCYWGPTIGP